MIIFPFLSHIGRWLTDEHINHAQSLLKEQFPDVCGLQDTLIFQAAEYGGMVGSPEGQFIQILHINGNHWVCLTSIGCEPGKVNIYDSLTPSSPRK